MRLKPINIADTRLSEEEIAAATEVLRSGMLRQGPKCDAFEQAFAEYVGAKHAIACANGTAALHMAWMDLLQPGDEVLVPSFTFFATASTVAVCGAVPVFCDVDPETFLLDLEDAKTRITERTVAVCPVHLYGNPVDAQAMESFAQRHSLTVVWDAAQAHGSKLNGKGVGALGPYSAYSFYPTKNLYVGEGGMVCTDDAERARRLRLLRDHGTTARYEHSLLGLNYRMTDIAGAIGLQQLKRLDAMLAIRRRNAAVLVEGLSKVAGLRLQRHTPGSEHAWHQFCLVVEPSEFGMDRDALAAHLKTQQITTGIHYPRGLHRQPVFVERYGEQSLEQTDYLGDHILALPVHHGMDEADAQRVVDAIKGARG